ncbi:hypothetical protein CHS0354_002989 [Potamilus streckersoni]|uniref:Uncharacterized protein n=1 Tax=Potamilus streckersoni TaxID=2493646 RepID=A0AAE0VI30_9BIVA|nr:hypothetical protein CHS0354_002989 [Potamilus streckersoni]
MNTKTSERAWDNILYHVYEVEGAAEEDNENEWREPEIDDVTRPSYDYEGLFHESTVLYIAEAADEYSENEWREPEIDDINKQVILVNIVTY